MRNRHPTKKRGTKPTYSHSIISLGTKDKKLLMHLLSNQNSRFNLRGYSNKVGLARSSIYDILNRLKRHGFVDREIANNKITEKGKIYLKKLGEFGDESKICYNRKIKNCVYCGKLLSKLSRRKKFCNGICRVKYRKSRLEKKDTNFHRNYTCSLCGFSRYPEAIEVHHIDKIRKNNTSQNKIEVCANCHKRLHAMSKDKYGDYVKTHIYKG